LALVVLEVTQIILVQQVVEIAYFQQLLQLVAVAVEAVVTATGHQREPHKAQLVALVVELQLPTQVD
jgi:hypothetical protein